jgi:hypothetical protein
MSSSSANIETAQAVRYMKQLCRHFSHRLPVTFDDERGRIQFDFGVCDLVAGEGVLTLRASADDDEGRARVEEVIARHLERFAHRDPFAVRWH